MADAERGEEQAMGAESIWGDLELDPGASHTVQLGTLVLHIERTDRELWLDTRRSDGPEEQAEGGGERTRWAIKPDATIHLAPAVPDRLVVVSHEHPFNLPPRGQARVFVRIPLHLQVVVHRQRDAEVIAADLPSLILSDTWWGTFTAGELAYWITTRARAAVTPEMFEPHTAVCPFQLTNASQAPLPITPFAVRVPHLSMFASGGEIWTDQVTVRYEGADEGSEIKFGGAPPPECPDGERIAEPRIEPPRGFRALTFDKLRLMTIPGI